MIPEFDVFVGRVACTQYETPGTKKFAETVLPFVQDYNTVLLGNHGIVCWADTVTHAEWYAEVLETYCWTLTIASQLGVPFARIPGREGGRPPQDQAAPGPARPAVQSGGVPARRDGRRGAGRDRGCASAGLCLR